MAWIESHQTLLAHRKTMRASAILKTDRLKLIGHLHALWWWGLSNADRDGSLGDVFPEEIAEGAVWPAKKADAFVQALISVRFLEVSSAGFRLHNWRKYTWRFYEQEEKREGSSSAGAFGNHKRWHLDRGVTSADCEFCVAGGHRPDIAPDSESESLPTNPPTDQPNQPTDRPRRGRRVTVDDPIDQVVADFAAFGAVNGGTVPAIEEAIADFGIDWTRRAVSEARGSGFEGQPGWNYVKRILERYQTQGGPDEPKPNRTGASATGRPAEEYHGGYNPDYPPVFVHRDTLKPL